MAESPQNQDKTETTAEAQNAVDVQKQTQMDGSKPPEESEPSLAPGDENNPVEEKIGGTPEKETTGNEQTAAQPQKEENVSSEPSKEPYKLPEVAEVHEEEKTEALLEEQTSVNEQTPSAEDKSTTSPKQEPSITPEEESHFQWENTKAVGEKQANVNRQILATSKEHILPETPEVPPSVQEVPEVNEKEKKEDTPEEQTTINEQVPSQPQEEENVPPEPSKEPSKVPDVTKEKTAAVLEKKTTVKGQTPSPKEERTTSPKQEPPIKPEGESPFQWENTKAVGEKQANVNRQILATSKEHILPETPEVPPSVQEVPEVNEKEKKEDTPEEQTTINEQVPSQPQEEENVPPEPSKEPSKVPDVTKEKTAAVLEKKTTEWGQIFSIIALVGVLLAVILPYIPSPSSKETDMPDLPPDRCNPRQGDCLLFLSQSIRNLSEKYKGQDSNSWRTLNAAALAHVSHGSKPLRPIVILVYWVNSSSHEIVFDISKVYASVLSDSKDDTNIIIQGKDFVNQESELVQREISEKLEQGFAKGKKVAIIHDFDDLPSCSVLTFHNYCNNEDAPYTDVAIILTMKGNPNMEPGQKPKVLEKSVEEIFQEKWSDCPEDLPPGKIDAILSRVANNVVLLQ